MYHLLVSPAALLLFLEVFMKKYTLFLVLFLVFFILFFSGLSAGEKIIAIALISLALQARR